MNCKDFTPEKIIQPAMERPGALVDASLIGQLHAARYTYHRQMIHKYGERVRTGQLSHEDAGKMYSMAMDNYDGIIKAAADGASQEANEADMKAGFVL